MGTGLSSAASDPSSEAIHFRVPARERLEGVVEGALDHRLGEAGLDQLGDERPPSAVPRVEVAGDDALERTEDRGDRTIRQVLPAGAPERLDPPGQIPRRKSGRRIAVASWAGPKRCTVSTPAASDGGR